MATAVDKKLAELERYIVHLQDEQEKYHSLVEQIWEATFVEAPPGFPPGWPRSASSVTTGV
jgi:hypothetical protein